MRSCSDRYCFVLLIQKNKHLIWICFFRLSLIVNFLYLCSTGFLAFFIYNNDHSMFCVPAVCSDGFMGLRAGNLPLQWTARTDKKQYEMVAQDICDFRNTLLTWNWSFSLHFFVWHYDFRFADRLCLIASTKVFGSVLASSLFSQCHAKNTIFYHAWILLLQYWYFFYLNSTWLGWRPFWAARKFR